MQKQNLNKKIAFGLGYIHQTWVGAQNLMLNGSLLSACCHPVCSIIHNRSCTNQYRNLFWDSYSRSYLFVFCFAEMSVVFKRILNRLK